MWGSTSLYFHSFHLNWNRAPWNMPSLTLCWEFLSLSSREIIFLYILEIQDYLWASMLHSNSHLEPFLLPKDTCENFMSTITPSLRIHTGFTPLFSSWLHRCHLAGSGSNFSRLWTLLYSSLQFLKYSVKTAGSQIIVATGILWPPGISSFGVHLKLHPIPTLIYPLPFSSKRVKVTHS